MEPKIIVIDPSDFSRSLTVKLLEELNFIIIGEANSAQKGRNLISTTNCNICLIDMNLTEITGIQFIEALLPRSDHLGIILTSYLNLETLKIDAILAGASDVLQSPVDKNSLEKSIYYLQKIITVRE